MERERDRLQQERDRLERERDRLRDELEAAHRAAKRQAAPFAKGPPAATPSGRAARRAALRAAALRPPPAHVDAVVAVFPRPSVRTAATRSSGRATCGCSTRPTFPRCAARDRVPLPRWTVPGLSATGRRPRCTADLDGDGRGGLAGRAARRGVGGVVAHGPRRPRGEGRDDLAHGVRADDHRGRPGAGAAPARSARLADVPRVGARRAAQSRGRARRDGVEGRRAACGGSGCP